MGSRNHFPEAIPIQNDVPGDIHRGTRTMSSGDHMSAAHPQQKNQRPVDDRGIGSIFDNQAKYLNISSGCSNYVGDDASGVMSLSSVSNHDFE
jgi:hypothetical protein